eukprot:4587682-Prymnesium_polylepis.1
MGHRPSCVPVVSMNFRISMNFRGGGWWWWWVRRGGCEVSAKHAPLVKRGMLVQCRDWGVMVTPPPL